MDRARGSLPNKTEQKIAWYGSVTFMVVAWLALAGLWLGVIVRAWLKGEIGGWEFPLYMALAVYLFVLLVIPIQLVRYYRERRNAKAGADLSSAS